MLTNGKGSTDHATQKAAPKAATRFDTLWEEHGQHYSNSPGGREWKSKCFGAVASDGLSRSEAIGHGQAIDGKAGANLAADRFSA
jgi:hypothetical protein